MSITEKNGLRVSQTSTYGADNASVNFGKHNSVFQKLREVNPHILKGNYKCHLIHNTLKNANKILSTAGYDAEAIVFKIYREFSFSAKRADYLKEFSGSWSVGMPKCYFLSLGKEDCPDIIWKVMCKSDADAVANSSGEDEVTVSECVLLFLQEFHCVILKLENESAVLLDVHEVMSRLCSQLILRREDRFYGHKTKQVT